METEKIRVTLRAESVGDTSLDDKRVLTVFAHRGDVAKLLDRFTEEVETTFEA